LILANYNGTYLFTTWPSGPQSMPDRDVRFVQQRTHAPQQIMRAGNSFAKAFNGANCDGPVQSKGMCLLESVVHWNLKPNASTEHTIDLPRVTSCPAPVSDPGGFIRCGLFKFSMAGARSRNIDFATKSSPFKFSCSNQVLAPQCGT
jgi:hypothetical protein